MTGERTYTVRELDALRSAVKHKWMWGVYQRPPMPPDVRSRGMIGIQGNDTKAVEELVRTHMLAGHTAADLIASEQD